MLALSLAALDATSGQKLVSVDLTADEIPATGGHRRFVPGPAFADVTCSGEHAASRRCYGKRGYAQLDDVCFRARRLSAAEPVRKAHREKGRVNPWGKQAFPLGSSRPFSCARKPQTFRSPHLTGGGCLFSPASIFADYGSRDEPRATACGGCFARGEINRNEQCPHEADLRRLRLRTLRTLAQVWARAAPSVPLSRYTR